MGDLESRLEQAERGIREDVVTLRVPHQGPEYDTIFRRDESNKAERMADLIRDALAAFREKDEEIARLKALARELNDGMCINCNRAPCRCPTEAR